MTRPTCAGSTLDPHCDRNVMRYRNGNGYCLWHPTEEPPVIDPKTGRPITAKPAKTPKHLQPAPAPDDLTDLQADLDELERTDPVVAAAAASYDAAVDHILAQPPAQEQPVPSAEPDTDLLTLQVAWKVTATLAGADSTRPAMRAAAREARRTIAVLVDELTYDTISAPAAPAAPASGTATPASGKRTEPLPCRKGCGKISNGPQGRSGHERHCTHVAATA